ncbi:hypothetical protein [Clostridium magnum]|uniref:Uncharacterized protein n=1 Tax=Clostridium magnum DSM 2767 TaxID=1121326 RepID=A0A161YLK4_9CLOT|nr:hypothetical protein [Clostridium magnum]KZL91482.1 hypothetical protein CLMAG_32410 [Clostridium magnum DSM 2767]SHH44107.1 hypothetical protein SAMN02745944_00680 [Clostridium magnum DSM 2767]
MGTWENKLFSPDVPFARYHYSRNTRYFHLVAEPINHNILKNLSTMEQQSAQDLIGAFILLPKENYIVSQEIPYRDYIVLLQQ